MCSANTFIHHIGISAAAEVLDEVAKFYDQILELKPGERPNFSFGGQWLYSGDQPIIHLLEDASRERQPSGYFDHVALRCDNFDQVVARLEQHNISYRQFEVAEVNQIQLFLTDPSGTRVELNFENA